MAKDPFNPTDDDARTLARELVLNARSGALATLRDGRPFVTRIALAPMGAEFLTLVSDLASHTAALRASPEASLLIGEPGSRGDPLTHPRMTLQVTATFLNKAEHAESYLALQPKAKLYIGFADFHLMRLTASEALLNGGFGKAYRLIPADLV